MQRIYLLKGKLQSYSWGGKDFLPQLLHFSNPEHRPYAEYWMGAHPSHSSSLQIQDNEVLLTQFINQNKTEVLGNVVKAECDSLPYLLKVLDVRQMLSIQVHPSKEEAALGFEREASERIPITASFRNYKDKNHKPEMMVALSPFWLLHGFKRREELLNVLECVPELNFLMPIFKEGGYKKLFAYIMGLDQEEVNRVLTPLRDRVVPLYSNGLSNKAEEDFWAARAFTTFCPKPPFDRGIFCIYLFNLLHLKRGEGVYQPSGMPHAYLEGQNVEIMANSDNVIRAGLTDKHIDVEELLKHTLCEPTVPNILHPSGQSTTEYRAPVKEFALWQYDLKQASKSFSTYSAEILIVLEGMVTIVSGEEMLRLEKGASVFILADTLVTLQTASEATVYRAAAGSA